MTPRPYVSAVRAAAAQEKRRQVLEAAARHLREESLAAFSLEAVARAAGVTRLTVYNQFGSRRGLLEAVFDELAQQGGLDRLSDAMAAPDPRAGLDQMVEIFCDFWSGDPAVGRVQDAIATDPELAYAVRDRNARRRQIVVALVERLAAQSAGPAATGDAADLIFALTSDPMFSMLQAGRSAEATCHLIKTACGEALNHIARQD